MRLDSISRVRKVCADQTTKLRTTSTFASTITKLAKFVARAGATIAAHTRYLPPQTYVDSFDFDFGHMLDFESIASHYTIPTPLAPLPRMADVAIRARGRNMRLATLRESKLHPPFTSFIYFSLDLK